MAIVDNRTLITNAESGGFVDASGSANGSTNTDFFIEGTGSHGVQVSASTDALLFDFGAAQNFTNNHFYIWWLLTTAGLADTLAGGGVRIRFAGSTISNFFEVNIAGKDTYSGGFVMSVIDIESAAATPDATGGTPPATNSIQYVGMFFDVPGMVPGNVPNCFVDAMWRLPANTPGMLVEGQNGGVDWTWGDIVNAADAGDPAKAWGTAFRRDGVVFINTPIRFGANDATTHGFSDTSEVIAWEDQTVASTFYDLEIIGGTGTQSFSIGTRVGTGDASIGHSGCVFLASTTGQRYTVTASDANIDTCEFLGCTFSHSSTIDVSNANSEIRSSLITDGSAATHADAGGDGIFQKNTVVNANTADGVAYLTTDNPAEIKNTSFVFSDGHAIEITQTGTYSFSGNTFSGYGGNGTNDAAIYNNSGGSVTLNITGGGDTPTVRNGAGASTDIVSSVSVDVHAEDENGTAIENAQVFIRKAGSYYDYTSHATNNTAGGSTFEVNEVVDTDLPQSGWLHVWDSSTNEKQEYRYQSWSGKIFTLRAEVTGSATSTGSSTSLVSTSTDFTTADIEEGDTIRNTTDSSWAIVDEIVDADNITTTELQGGTDNTWEASDAFSLHRLAVTYEAADLVDIPLFNGQTNASGDISTTFGGTTPASITVRIRSNEGTTKFVPFNTSGTIESTGFSLTAVLAEDTVAS